MKNYRVDFLFARENLSDGEYETSQRFYEVRADSHVDAVAKAKNMLKDNEPTLKIIESVTVEDKESI